MMDEREALAAAEQKVRGALAYALDCGRDWLHVGREDLRRILGELDSARSRADAWSSAFASAQGPKDRAAEQVEQSARVLAVDGIHRCQKWADMLSQIGRECDPDWDSDERDPEEALDAFRSLTQELEDAVVQSADESLVESPPAPLRAEMELLLASKNAKQVHGSYAEAIVGKLVREALTGDDPSWMAMVLTVLGYAHPEMAEQEIPGLSDLSNRVADNDDRITAIEADMESLQRCSREIAKSFRCLGEGGIPVGWDKRRINDVIAEALEVFSASVGEEQS